MPALAQVFFCAFHLANEQANLLLADMWYCIASST